jgi:hypothetical protein
MDIRAIPLFASPLLLSFGAAACVTRNADKGQEKTVEEACKDYFLKIGECYGDDGDYEHYADQYCEHYADAYSDDPACEEAYRDFFICMSELSCSQIMQANG